MRGRRPKPTRLKVFTGNPGKRPMNKHEPKFEPAVPDCPTELGPVARQLTEAFPWNEAPRYLIRDRDRIYGEVARRRIRAIGIRDKPIASASPWQNGFAERMIGSIRRECLDHLVILSDAHLRGILQAYACYYNKIRTHRSLD